MSDMGLTYADIYPQTYTPNCAPKHIPWFLEHPGTLRYGDESNFKNSQIVFGMAPGWPTRVHEQLTIWYTTMQPESSRGNLKRITSKRSDVCGCEKYQKNAIAGWWLSHPSEKYESMGRMTSHIWKIIQSCLKPPTSNFHIIFHVFFFTIHRLPKVKCPCRKPLIHPSSSP